MNEPGATLGVLLGLAGVGVGCSRSHDSRSTGNELLSEADALPTLVATPRMPLPTAAGYRQVRTSVIFENVHDDASVGASSGEDAVRSARRWIEAQFGPMPESTDLIAKRVGHEDDSGRPLVLWERYRGVATQHGVVLEGWGQPTFTAYCDLLALKPVDASAAMVISGAVALASARREVAAESHAMARLDESDRAELMYVFDSDGLARGDAPKLAEGIRVKPAWVLIKADGFTLAGVVVDGYSGRVDFGVCGTGEDAGK